MNRRIQLLQLTKCREEIQKKMQKKIATLLSFLCIESSKATDNLPRIERKLIFVELNYVMMPKYNLIPLVIKSE